MNTFPSFCWCGWWAKRHRGLWFRVSGFGLHISTRKRSEALFSERNGLRHALYVFGLRFEVLRP